MEHEQNGGHSDRERRAELEQLQTELRDARAELARGHPARLGALETALAEARAKLEQTRSRADRLEGACVATADRARILEGEIEETRIQNLGAARRDHYVDWAPQGTSPEIKPNQDFGISSDDYDGSNPAVIIVPIVVIGIALMAFMTLVGHC